MRGAIERKKPVRKRGAGSTVGEAAGDSGGRRLPLQSEY